MECVADVAAVLGEGPVWVERDQALYWLDIPQKRLFRWSPSDALKTFDLPAPLCSIVPRASGGFVGAGYDGFVAVTLEPELAFHPIGNPEEDLPGNRFNDGKVDRQGRFWAGTMDRREQQASGSLYRLAADRSWTQVDSGYRVTNGPAFSADGRTLYHNDSALQRIYAFDLAADGSVGNKRVCAQFSGGEGYPDGMTVDSENCLWVAFWDGWCVRRLSPEGEVIATIDVPVQRPTSCAFGGKDFDLLFITSARRDLSPEALQSQPQAGGLFMTRTGVTGLAERAFAG